MSLIDFQKHYVELGKDVSTTLKTLNPFEAAKEERGDLLGGLQELQQMIHTAAAVADLIAKHKVPVTPAEEKSKAAAPPAKK